MIYSVRHGVICSIKLDVEIFGRESKRRQECNLAGVRYGRTSRLSRLREVMEETREI